MIVTYLEGLRAANKLRQQKFYPTLKRKFTNPDPRLSIERVTRVVCKHYDCSEHIVDRRSTIASHIKNIIFYICIVYFQCSQAAVARHCRQSRPALNKAHRKMIKNITEYEIELNILKVKLGV